MEKSSRRLPASRTDYIEEDLPHAERIAQEPELRQCGINLADELEAPRGCLGPDAAIRQGRMRARSEAAPSQRRATGVLSQARGG